MNIQDLPNIVFLCCAVHIQSSFSLIGVVKTIAGAGDHHVGSVEECLGYFKGRDGTCQEARFSYPWGVTYDNKRNVIYVADCGCRETQHANDRIRKIDVNKCMVSTIAGSTKGYKDGTGEAAMFSEIAGMTLDTNGEIMYIADSANRRIRMLHVETGKVETLAGNEEPGLTDGIGMKAEFDNPQDVLFYENFHGNLLIVADTDNHAIRSIDLTTGNVSTIAGNDKGFKDGIGKMAKFYHPTCLALDIGRNIIFISDHYNHAIRKMNFETGQVTTLSGGGAGFKNGHVTQSLFHYPEGIAYDNKLDILYLVEFENNAVRAISNDGHVTLIAGGGPGDNDGVGQLARFYHPTRLAFDEKAKILYVSDQYNHLIRSVSTEGSDATDPKYTLINQVHQHIDAYGLIIAIPIYGLIVMLFGFFVARPVVKKCKHFRNNKYLQ